MGPRSGSADWGSLDLDQGLRYPHPHLNKTADSMDEGAAIEALVEVEAELAGRRYRAEPEQVRAVFREAFAADRELLALLEGELDLDRLRRTRICKEAVKRTRARLYHELRRYVADREDLESCVQRLEGGAAEAADEVAARHVSTAERAVDLEAFHRALAPSLEGCRSVIDLGAGVHPLTFPFDGLGREVARYLALERDPLCLRAIRAQAALRGDGRLEGRAWEATEGFDEETFDLAFAFKLIPVLERQERESLAILARAPAPRWVLSGSRVALARRQDIEHRERRALQRFLDLAGLRQTGEFTTATELVLVAER